MTLALITFCLEVESVGCSARGFAESQNTRSRIGGHTCLLAVRLGVLECNVYFTRESVLREDDPFVTCIFIHMAEVSDITILLWLSMTKDKVIRLYLCCDFVS